MINDQFFDVVLDELESWNPDNLEVETYHDERLEVRGYFDRKAEDYLLTWGDEMAEYLRKQSGVYDASFDMYGHVDGESVLIWECYE